MSATAQSRDIIYWQQRCIAVEAKEQALNFEVTQLKSNLKHYKEQATYWQQRYIIAEAKVTTLQNANHGRNAASTTGPTGPGTNLAE